MSDSVDLGALAGMTPEWADTLRARTFFSIADLLRANNSALLAVVPGLTRERLNSWQAFAGILEIDAMIPAVSAACVSAGIESLEEFATRSLTQLRAIMQSVSFPSGTAPGDDTLVAWLTDATRLAHSGVLNGTVLTHDGVVVEGAVVRCDNVHAVTDARGRFRLVRLKLGYPLLLEISHEVRGVRRFQNVKAVRRNVFGGRRFAFPKRPAAPKTLSALNGDPLPPIGTAPITTKTQEGLPAAKDIVRVCGGYANGDVKTVSVFLDFAAGEFIARTYRMPPGLLPEGIKVMDTLRHESGKWVVVDFCPRCVARRQRLFRVLRTRPAKVTDAVLERRAKAILSALSDS